MHTYKIEYWSIENGKLTELGEIVEMERPCFTNREFRILIAHLQFHVGYKDFAKMVGVVYRDNIEIFKVYAFTQEESSSIHTQTVIVKYAPIPMISVHRYMTIAE